ncbi:antitoxin [[Mycobacterium] vasticus]|uniref:Antitoxin n=1 Tax=[Mycobacterium] vasticus TaxID=2875777 RepID=A0ABU5Z293_9MYCO|nr:antitoxin [Mycolicibacter sp. MYC017]MEB3071517.1 antitoxin [Mycolicibacter sp. MYC017]
MSMSLLGHRLQILIDDERHRRITAAARERGVSVATVVREAIDRGLAGPIDRRESAGQRLLDAPDMDVPELTALKQELDALRGRRG